MMWEFIKNPPFLLNTKSLSPDRLAAWEAVQVKLPIRAILTGSVFARTHFGGFLDAGIGFPVRMNVTDFGKPEGSMIFPDDYPTLGSEISGQLAGFDELTHQIVVVRKQTL